MLQFTVIAGPNGAGKSTFSTRMSQREALVFDPDQHKLKIEKQYPDISEEAIETAVSRKYDVMELRALATQKSFTVETNLRNLFLADQAMHFKKNGYQTRLVFMLLPDVESSMDRVNLRVKQHGHFVDAESIRYNFLKSLENLKHAVKSFDQVMLVCAAANYGIVSLPELLLTVKNGVVIQKSTDLPNWTVVLVEDIIQFISGNNRTSGFRR